MIKTTENYQYEIMTEEQKTETGYYVPNFQELIKQAPNEAIAQKWKECEAKIEETKGKTFSFDGFAFRGVYIIQKTCGHYEIFQTPVRSEDELIDWIENVALTDNKKCTRCICGGH